MRTTTWDIVKFAWALWRHRYRRTLRIAQIINFNSFYLENEQFIRRINGRI